MPYKNKEEQKEYQKQHYLSNTDSYKQSVKNNRRKTAEWFADFKKGLKCEVCGEDHPACLDFHHLDKKQKRQKVTDLAKRTYSVTTVLAEIEKCQVLCSNCHRKLHYNERNEF